MALLKCNECGNQVSDKASACPHCGAPVAPLETVPIALERNAETHAKSKPKLWLWIPLGLIVAFFAFGALTPQYKTDAVRARKACEVMIGAETYRQRECDLIYSNIISRGESESKR